MSKANLNFDEINRELLSFLDHSPSAFHATANMCEMLKEAGCTPVCMRGRNGIWRPAAATMSPEMILP